MLYGSGKMKILIVDDYEVGCFLLEKQLSDYGTLVTVNNGSKAIEVFKDALDEGERFDLICLDYVMPEINGMKVLKTIRQIESEYQITRDEGVRIIMVSAVGYEEEVVKAYENGCDAYIIRPYQKEQLTAEIHKAFTLR